MSPIIVVFNPAVHSRVGMKDKRHSSADEVVVKVSNLMRTEYNPISISKSDNQTRLYQTKFPPFAVRDLENHADFLVAIVTMHDGANVEVENESSEGMGKNRISERKDVDRLF